MTEDGVTPSGVFDLDGASVLVRADPYIRGVWGVYREDHLLGTIADTHSYQPATPAGYIVHRADASAPGHIRSWSDSIRFLLSSRDSDNQPRPTNLIPELWDISTTVLEGSRISTIEP